MLNNQWGWKRYSIEISCSEEERHKYYAILSKPTTKTQLLSKILRTIIGLPLVVVLWPLGLFIAVATPIILYLPVWLFDPDSEFIDWDYIIGAATIPWQFIKKVWEL